MLGILLLTLGALNAALALSVETCTQGGADSLYGGFLTLLLYGAGAAALAARPPRGAACLALLPAAGLAARHSLFAARFAWNYWRHDFSACHALSGAFPAGEAGEWMDGGEPMLTALWLGLSLLFWTGVAAGLRRSRALRK